MTQSYLDGAKQYFTAPIDFTVQQNLKTTDGLISATGKFLAGHSATPMVAVVAVGDAVTHVGYLAMDAVKAGYNVTLGTTRGALNLVPFVDLTGFIAEGHMSEAGNLLVVAIKDVFHSVVSIVAIPVSVLTPFYASVMMHMSGAHENKIFTTLDLIYQLDTLSQEILETVPALEATEENYEMLIAKKQTLNEIIEKYYAANNTDAYDFIHKNNVTTNDDEERIGSNVIDAMEVLDKSIANMPFDIECIRLATLEPEDATVKTEISPEEKVLRAEKNKAKVATLKASAAMLAAEKKEALAVKVAANAKKTAEKAHIEFVKAEKAAKKATAEARHAKNLAPADAHTAELISIADAAIASRNEKDQIAIGTALEASALEFEVANAKKELEIAVEAYKTASSKYFKY